MTPIVACKAAAIPGSRQLRPRQQRGFTLLEIMLVLAIIATASILLVPNLGSLEARTFNTQLRQAQSLLNYARRTAVVSGQASTVSFYVIPLADIDRLESEEGQPKLNNVVAQWHGAGINLRFRDSTDKEIEIEKTTEVTFYPEGGSTGGMLLFAQADQTATINIDPFTGRVSSQDSEKE